MTDFLFLMDIAGTFVFGLTGAFRAIKYELDILGVLVLATVVGVGGGMTRDVLLGVTPPVAISCWEYLLTTYCAGLLVFFFARKIAPTWRYILYADAVGLGLFAAVGAEKAYIAGLGPVGIMVIAAIASVGGGVIRDILTREMPVVFTDDIYATAALAGGLVYYLCVKFDTPGRIPFYSTLIFVIAVRLFALKMNLYLPRSKKLPMSPSQIASCNKSSDKVI
jgi:uncharacterized membrane protein YeiH